MNRPGFSLIEALFALVLLGAVAITALAATSSHSEAALRAQRLAEAAILAELELTRVFALSPAELRALPAEVESAPFTTPMDHYRAVQNVTRTPADTAVFEVAVAILWDEGRFDLKSLLYRPMGAIP